MFKYLFNSLWSNVKTIVPREQSLTGDYVKTEMFSFSLFGLRKAPKAQIGQSKIDTGKVSHFLVVI